MFIQLIAAAVGSYALYEAVKPKRANAAANATSVADGYQSVSTVNSSGMPIQVVTPTAEGVTPVQSGAVPAPRKKPKKPAPNAPVPVVSQPSSQGAVYAPVGTVVPDGHGGTQPAPVIITPAGAASIVVAGVKDVQKGLNALGLKPKLKEDGILGPQTVAALKAFQKRVGLVVDGNASPAVFQAISSALAALAQTHQSPPPAAVAAAASQPLTKKQIQQALNAKGAKPALVADGVFGAKTIAAIKAFQLSRGLTADGVAGPQTQAALLAQGGG